MIKRKFVLFFLLFGCVVGLISQKNELNQITKFTNDLGLASNYVYQIIQDKKGFIWIGTEEGLNKFDGKNFSEFTTKPGRYSLSHNRAQTVMLAPDGNIWVGTSDGINIYDYKSDSVIRVRTNTAPLKLKYNDITFLTTSKNGKTTWIGTYGNGIHYYNWDKKEFDRFKLPLIHGVKEPLLVMSILEDDSKRLWIGTQNNGLYKYDLEQRTFEYCPLKEQNLFVQAIYQDSYRRLWIGTNKGCYIYNETTDLFDPVTYPEGLKTNSINVFREDHQGKLWIGSDLFLMNFTTRSFSKTEKFNYQIYTHGESSFTLNCPSISSILVDRDNNIWIGTVWGGVNMMQGVQSKFKLYKQEPDIPFSLPKTPITGICKDNEGNILLSTNTKGIYKMNSTTLQFRKFATSNNYAGYDFQTILNDNQGKIWLGTFKNGVVVMDKNGIEKTHFTQNPLDANSLPDNDVRCLYQSENHNIWVATQKGTAVINSQTLKIERVIHLNNNAGVRVIKEDADGLIWFGTYGDGVVTYNPSTKQLNNSPTPLNLTIVYDIFINNDNVWFATHGQGVFLYNKNTKKTYHYSEKEGLPTNFVRSILRDKNGFIWVGTPKGISKINPKTHEIQNFNTQDGLQTQGFYERSVYLSPEGQMYFGGYTGLNVFNPQNVTKNDRCPQVIFTKLSVFNQTISPSNNKHKSSPIKENINIADKIKLNYDQSVFSIEFIGLNYNASQKIQYAYMLKGVDSKWNNLGNQNNITFRNLSPGSYELQVKASSPDGVWSEDNVTSINIVIKPPFWKSWWASLIYILILAVILYFVWQFTTLKIKSENELKIERAKLEKEEELHQEKLQFFTNISHEFRTPLTLIIGPLEKLQAEETNETKKSNIRLMSRNARRLLVMVNQLLDFRKTERGQMSLNIKYADIIAFVKEIMHSYEELKETKNIKFDFEHKEEVLMTWFDPEFIDKCLFNLLSNAFKFTPDKGKIIVSVDKNNENVEISVADNGRGIPENEQTLIFNRFYTGKEHSTMQPGSGVGLHLTKNLVELHHGKISVISIPNKKTIFTISIPANQKAYSLDEFANESTATSRQINGDFESETTIYEKTQTDKENPDKYKKRILLVEDNAEIRKYIIEILGTHYIIDEAENGIEGLKKAIEKEYNLVISDLMMPEMDGIEMCKQLKSNIETDHIPIVMLTAKSSIENKIEGLNVGADSYISKPFHPEHLSVRVAKLIEQREMFKDRYSKKILLENIQNQENKTESPDEKFLQKIVAVILDRMSETDFNGDVLASELYISRMGLHRKIKALTGQSTGEFIRNVRLKKACELLIVSGKNVSDVCYDVGFNSPSYFTTCFTEVYKMTPSEYVKNQKK